jgi:hypothetical protein
MLPPWVITRGGKFLGPNGWTPQREGALSFEHAAAAQDWKASVPALTGGAIVASVPHEPENPGQPKPMQHEFDPHGEAA